MDLSDFNLGGGGLLSLDGYMGTQTREQTQDEPAQGLLYRLSSNPDELHPLRNKEHMRLLLASLDKDLEWWVTFSFPDKPGFAQAAQRFNNLPIPEGLLVVEINTIPYHFSDRVIKSEGNDGVSNPASENFGNMDTLLSQEYHTASEAFAICFSWMDKGTLPEGYMVAPVEE